MPEEVGPKVFVVHGHNLSLRDKVTAYLKELGITPVVLQEGTNQGDTVIEKLERYSGDVTYAIVIMSPDDLGTDRKNLAQAVKVADNARKSVVAPVELVRAMMEMQFALLSPLTTRARQNVILELGYFIGKLGRKRLCIIVQKPLGHLAMARWQQDPDIDSDTADTVLFRLPGVSDWEFPSDTHGMTIIDYKDGWGDKLLRELQAAGII